MSVASAVQRDLAAIRLRAPEIADSALAASALALAERMDDGETSATAVSNCARALTEVLEHLLALVPPAERRDELDDLNARRRQRRAG